MTKLHFSPHFHIEILDSEQVVLFSEDRYHLLRGFIYVEIARILHKDHLLEQDLKNQLLSRFSSEDVQEALNRLQNKNFIIPYHESAQKNIAAFWSELSLTEPESRLTVGIKNFSRHCSNALVQALENLSIHTDEKENFFIVIVDNYISEEVEAFNNARISDKKPWMLLKPSGRIIWLGPIFEPSHKLGCWDCLVRRLKENRRVEVDLFGLENCNHNIPPLSSLPTSCTIAMNLAANEVAKWERSSQTHMLRRNLLTFDMKSLETRYHFFQRQFNCSKCETNDKSKRQSRINLKPSLKRYFYDSERACSLEDTFHNLENIISPITGIISSLRYAIVNDENICYTVRTLPLPAQHNHNDRYLRMPDVATGKGKTKLQATVGCIAETIERYNCTFTNQEEIRCYYHDIEKEAIYPSLLLNFSDKQYENREKINEQQIGFNRIPKPYDDSEIGWTAVFSMTHDRFRYVPSSYCYLHYPFDTDVEICPGNSNGCASGNSLEEAIFYSLLEIIERDAVAIWWYNRLKRPCVDLKNMNDGSLDQIQNRFKKADREMFILDLTTDLQIPCYAAVSWKSTGSQIFFGTGSHLHPRTAISRAINELNQVMIRSDTPKNIDLNSIAYFERDLVKWVITENIENHPYIIPDGICRPISQFPKSEDFLTDINLILDILKSLGLEVFLLDLTNPNFQLHTVRVIVPGLRHFWCRLGPGRLYDTPVNLGWIKNSLAESNMNPIPYFL
jgi:oxazoline/thiazoline synthase